VEERAVKIIWIAWVAFAGTSLLGWAETQATLPERYAEAVLAVEGMV